MGQITLGEQASPTTPTSGVIIYPTVATPSIPMLKDDSGNDWIITRMEAGTWTPDLRFGGNATGITYTSRSGKYRTYRSATDRFLIVTFAFILSSKGSATGGATIRGIPEGADPGDGAVAWRYAANLSSVTTMLLAYASNNNGGEIVLGQLSSGSFATLTDANFQNTSRLEGAYVTTI